MKWKSKHINLGSIKEGFIKTIIFEAEEDLENITTMHSSCGCSTPTLDGKRKIVIKFSPGYVPVHLYNIGYYTKTPTVTINYQDGQSDVLSFTAKIIKN